MLITLLSVALAKTTASSVLTDAEGKHGAELAADGLLTTGWGEGASGYGEGAWWELDLGTNTALQSISLWPGNLAKGARSYREYSRPKRIKVYVDGAVQGDVINIPDDKMQRVDVPLSVSGKKIRIEAVEVYEGGVYADLFISEVAVNYVAGDRAKQVDKLLAWKDSKEGQRAYAEYEEKVLAAYDTHKADGNELDSLKFLVDCAADGPPYLRRRADSLVPDGYRAAALEPDEKAMMAIRKLKNPYAIPGLEMAMTRAVGDAQEELKEIVEIFYAYQDLISGGRRNIKAWGEPGWEKGALRSFGEPLALEIDRFGDVYVADTGNNRVQMYDQGGISKKQWGAQPDASNAWLGGDRTWYAAGSAASDAQGAFTNPLDVELIPGKEADGFAVLDGKGRVQIFDAEGNPTIGWPVNVDYSPDAGVGGEGFLAWNAKKEVLIAVLGRYGVVYRLDSEEVGRFKLEDGTPKAMEVGKDGKLYLGYGYDVVAYNGLDGFRYGKVFGQEVLGEGYEDFDITLDEEGKMWVVTDRGWVYKFKKPGKLEWKVRVIEDYDLSHPRAAVSQGMVYLTDRDRIVRRDALQKHLDEEAEAAGAAPEGDKKKGK